MSGEPLAIHIRQLSYQYGRLRALDGLELIVPQSAIFALLGPNGSGKSTLFRLLSTVEPYQQGSVTFFGRELRENSTWARSMMGVVFQSPGLDPILTVKENLAMQGVLYGLTGLELARRIDETTEQLKLQSRLGDRVATLSGGLKRRVELAKGMLHRPKLLLMDEPSTGLDPASRLDWWDALRTLQASHGVTVCLTTHLLDEADKADQIAILDRGRNVASGAPEELKEQLGNQVLTVRTTSPQPILSWLSEQAVAAELCGGGIRATGSQVPALVAPLVDKFGNQIQMASIGPPSLEDVFIAKTGRPFSDENSLEEAGNQ
jgi:ABC-2 type transport system ATP-binding protein